MSTENNSQSIQVLEKASLILDTLLQDSDLSAAVLAERIGEPRSTTYRLLSSLQSLGLLERGQRRGTYRLGLRLLELGSSVIARYDERQAALPAMEELHAATGETVNLCILREFDAVCIERLDGEHVQLLELRLGGSLPLHLGAAPKTLLAYQDESFRRRYLDECELKRQSDGKPIKPSQLRADLREIRSRGYAISDEDVTIGIAAIGAPVFDYTGGVRATISIGGTKPAIFGDKASMTQKTVAAAEKISFALGFRRPLAGAHSAS